MAEYYTRNKGRVTPPTDLPPESAALFRSHDICHVIFGLDTTLADEAMADTRTVLGCDVGLRKYARYMSSDAQAKAILKQVGYGVAAWATILALPRMVRAAAARLGIRRRWPWEPPPAFMDRTLAELRREFGIKVI